MQSYLPIPGAPESSEPQVTPTTTKGSKKVSENSDHTDNNAQDTAEDHNEGLENNAGVNNPSYENNDLIIDEGPAPNEGDDQDKDLGKGPKEPSHPPSHQ